MDTHDESEVYNCGQMTQFTGVPKLKQITGSMYFTGRAKNKSLSACESGRRFIKHEDVGLSGHASLGELLIGLTNSLPFHAGERPNEARGNRKPDSVRASRAGGGTLIVEKHRTKQRLTPELYAMATTLQDVSRENMPILHKLASAI